MKSIPVFFDTEFTNFDTPELLSLSAVTADGQHEFYEEVSPLPEGCSEFVTAHVIPLFTGPGYDKESVAQHFFDWLSSFQSDIELYADSQYDRNIIVALYGKFPIRFPHGGRCFWCPLPGGVPNNPHHALEDARLARKLFESYF